MQERDWNIIDRSLDELAELVEFVSLPGKHSAQLNTLERLTQVFYDADIARDKCSTLRTLARRFYGSRRRRWPAAEIDSIHWQMIGCVASIRMRIEMHKNAEKSGVIDGS
jgi:hypothetical protein